MIRTDVDLNQELSEVAPLVVRTRERARAGGVEPDALVFAPGRVNLIGEHTDYSEGFVLPMTLPRGTCIAARARDDGRIRIVASATREEFEGGVPNASDDDGIRDAPMFARFALGVFAGGRGANIFVDSSLSIGSGLSSSASYLCALLLARDVLRGHDGRPASQATKSDDVAWAIAREARRIENEVIGVASGILDPAAICLSSSTSALLLDCRSLQTRAIKVPSSWSVVVANSGGQRSLATSAYNDRYESCTNAAKVLGVGALRDLDSGRLGRARGKLDPESFRRVRHVVSENERVHAFVRALEDTDATSAGELLNASHESLRDDFEVTGALLDSLSQIMRDVDGVYGARMFGAGFGGCCLALCERGAADAACKSIDAAWAAAGHGPAKSFVAVPAGAARAFAL